MSENTSHVPDRWDREPRWRNVNFDGKLKAAKERRAA